MTADHLVCPSTHFLCGRTSLGCGVCSSSSTAMNPLPSLEKVEQAVWTPDSKERDWEACLFSLETL